MPNVTSTNKTDISYVIESTPGTTPTTPSFQLLPTTGGGPMGENTTAVSEVIRSDRQIDDLVLVDQDVNGAISKELSYTPYKPLIISLLQDDTPNTINIVDATDIGVTSPSTFTSSTTSFVTSGVVKDSFFKASGFANAENNGVFRVETVTANSITVSSTTLTTEAAGVTVTFNGISYRNGTKNPPDSYTFLKRVITPVETSHFYYAGCQISGMTFNFTTGSILNGEMQIVGLEETITDTPLAGQTVTNVPSYQIMNSVTSLLRMKVGGISADAVFSTLNMNINNNINAAKGISYLGAAALASFTLDITNEMEVYYEQKTIYDNYKAGNAFDIEMVLDDGDGNNIGIFLPNCKMETLETPIPGKDEFFMANGSIRALRDATENYMVQFTFMDA